MDTQWNIYIIQCNDGKFYTGITTDIDRRLREHNSGNGGRFTKYRKPVELVYKEHDVDRAGALKREAEIKKMNRREKLDLIRFFSPCGGSGRFLA